MLVLLAAACCLSGPVPVWCGEAETAPLPLPAAGKPNLPGTDGIFGFQNPAAQLVPLSSVAATGIDISAQQVPVPLKGLVGVKLSIKNNSDRPLDIDADVTSATIGDVHLLAAPMKEIADRIRESDNPRGYAVREAENVVTAAVTMGVAQTVEGQSRLMGPIPNRYGWDNIRRIDRLGRFGKRVVWPGDSTEGIIYFKTNQRLGGGAIVIPVCAFYDKNDKYSASCAIK